MKYLNLHTHCALPEGEATLPAYGLHPWHLTGAWASDLQTLFPRSGSFLIGECGLDRLCDTPYDRQRAAFEAQIRLSEQRELPILVHCVHAVDDLLRLKRGTLQPWILHGFRGKPQQMLQLLRHGFYLSFGVLHNDESLRTCPADRLFLETDDKPDPVAPLYEVAAKLRKTTPEELNRQCWANASDVGLSEGLRSSSPTPPS